MRDGFAAARRGPRPNPPTEEVFMKRLRTALLLLLAAAAVPAALPAGDAPKRTPREALQPFNVLIGSWRGTGVPSGTRAEQQRGFWSETVSWEWQFKGQDAWLKFA